MNDTEYTESNETEYVDVNDTGTVELLCEQNYDTLALQWMDLFNSTVVPFILMLILSIALIYIVRRSRHRVNRVKRMSILSVQSSSTQSTRRDNRLAVSVISLNIIFFLLNLPIVIFNIFSVNSEPSDLINYSVYVLYYTNYAIGFYAQLIVNIDFRNAFLKLLNLRVIGLNVSDMGSTKALERTDN